MTTRRLFLFVLCVGILTNIDLVRGDGKVFIRVNKEADIYQPTQKAYIRWDGSEEKLLLQTKYEGPAEEMVWVVPVPSEPKVEKGDPNVFETLSRRTQRNDLSYTYFMSLQTFSAGAPGMPPNTVKWRRRIGDYDVVLLSPVGGEHVIKWLNSNQFGVPDEAVPILEQYIANKWWMVAAKIHRDALTDVTRDKLATGTLHPLEYTFKSSKCVYPLKLTSLTAGPVEELIYIEGPAHYEPVTVKGNWEIDVFGGPVRKVPNMYRISAVEHVVAIKDGRAKETVEMHLTKLRKVFEPNEMTDDIVFEKLDYARLQRMGTPSAIGQAATQYGRHRDPEGVPFLLASLSAEHLEKVRPQDEDYVQHPHIPARTISFEAYEKYRDQCAHMRSCIWALGEIAMEHGGDADAEETLISCIEHDSPFIRMEAYVALTKMGSENLGPVLLGQLTRALIDGTTYRQSPWSLFGIFRGAEEDFIVEWLEQFGTPDDKEGYIKLLARAVATLPPDFDKDIAAWSWQGGTPASLTGWVIRRAARTQDVRLLPSLQDFRMRVNTDTPAMIRFLHFLLTAEAACGSQEAVTMAARYLADNQDIVTRQVKTDFQIFYEELRSGGAASILLDSRRRRLRKQLTARVMLDRLLREACDKTIHAALAEKELDEWYVLCLLARVAQPLDQDRQRIRMIWDKDNEPTRLLATNVLWVWKDTKTLLKLHKQCPEGDVKTEIQRALDSLGDP